MNTNKLMEMYNSTFQPALAEGKYKVRMLSHEYVENANGVSKKPYIKFTFEVIDTGRKLVENRFDSGFGVLVSHLRQQLKRENEAIEPKKFFNELIENKTEFYIWIVKRIVDGYPKTNFNFLEPKKEEKPNTTVEGETSDKVEETTPDKVEETTATSDIDALVESNS